MSDDIYSKLNIDLSRLTRDYIKNPLKKSIYVEAFKQYKWELPNVEDLKYLYLELGLRKQDLQEYFSVSIPVLSRYMRANGIEKNTKHDMKNNKDFYNQYKIDISKLTRDYINNPLRLTKRRGLKYEEPNPDDVKYLLQEKKILFKEVARYFQYGEGLLHDYCNKYKIETPLRELDYDEIKQKRITQEIIDEFNIDVSKLTRNYAQQPLERIPDKTAMGFHIEFPNKKDVEYLFITLNMRREDISRFFGVSEPQMKIWNRKLGIKKSMVDVWKNSFKTSMKNGTINTSKPEEEIFIKLKSKFKNVLRQYKDDKRYPFYCDFYLPDYDIFIEYQGHLSHGKSPFVGSKEQWKLVEKYMKKEKERKAINSNTETQYSGYIDVWLYRDWLKRLIAKKYKLKWYEFFNLTDFNNWFNTLSGDK